MRQNLALSALILLSLVPLAGAGVLGLATAVAIHELAEVIVIANGVRAARRGAFAHREASPPVVTTRREAAESPPASPDASPPPPPTAQPTLSDPA
jgi:cation-transporting ATPase G